VIDDVPQGTWKTITFVAALRHDNMVAPMVFDGPMTGQMFLAYGMTLRLMNPKVFAARDKNAAAALSDRSKNCNDIILRISSNLHANVGSSTAH